MSTAASKQSRVLGLDVGIGSVGVCVLNETTQHIEGMYVRAFDKAEQPKTGESLNKIRRDARGTRRRLRRRRLRLEHCLKDLIRLGQMNQSPAELREAITDIDPWSMRVRALDAPIGNIEFCAVIYHLQKYRGFQSNRKAEQDDKEVSLFKSKIEANREAMRKLGARTVGELATMDERFKAQKRNRRGDYQRLVDRAEIAYELSAIFAAQRNFSASNPIFSEESEQAQRELLYRRRPTATGDQVLKSVGFCSREPEEKRAPAATLTSERFKWLCSVNNCRIKSPAGERSLTASERTALYPEPFKKTKITFAQARKLLGLKEDETFNLCRYRGGVEESEKRTWFEATAFHKIRKVLPTGRIDTLKQEQIDDIGFALTAYKTDDDIRAALSHLPLAELEVEALLSLSFERFGQLSLKAMRQMLPALEEGHIYSEAAQVAGYHHSQRPASAMASKLPLDFGEVTNPVVARALLQAIKVINAVIAKHGLPERIHLELSRDIGRNFKARKDVEREQEKNRKQMEQLEKEFIQAFGKPPEKKIDLRKFQFYKQQDGKCLYSGQPLVLNRLFETGYADIDHILPFSRTCDDSLNNKCVVLGRENRFKGNQTPFEYLGSDENSTRWHAFKTLVAACSGLPYPKKQRLLRNQLGPLDDFIARNLNDTRYFSRLLKEHIETHLQSASGHPMRVVTPAGQMTSLLRARWGLHKFREHGDKHHALDAAVVAACDRSLIQRITRYAKRDELADIREPTIDYATGEAIRPEDVERLERDFPMPYPDFRKEVLGRLSDDPRVDLATLSYYIEHPSELEAVRPLLVSRPVRRRGTGAAHEETVRRPIYAEDGVTVEKTYSRKNLTDLKLTDLEKIRGAQDPREQKFIEALRQRLVEFDGDGKKAFSEDRPFYRPSKNDRVAPRVHTVTVESNKISGIVLPNKPGFVSNGDTIRLDVFRDSGGWVGVPVYVHHVARGLPAPPSEDSEYHFSLYPGTYVRIEKPSNDVICGYYSGFDRNTHSITLRSHDSDQRKGSNGDYRSLGIRRLKDFRIGDVGLLGQVSWRPTCTQPRPAI